MTTDLKAESFDVYGHSIELLIPTDPDRLLDEAARLDGKDPYWGVVWKAAIDSANCVLRTEWPTNQRTLELGCGAGLLGVAGLLAGLDITFSDHVPEAVELAQENADRNGFPNAGGTIIDWQAPTPVPESEQYELLIASDVLYECSLHEPLLKAAEMMLKPEGSFRIGDPGRHNSRDFLNLASDQGWRVELFDRNLWQVGVPTHAKFHWIVLRK